MKILMAIGFIISAASGTLAQDKPENSAGGAGKPVAFASQDGGTVHGLLYGKGKKGVVLVHGGRFNKESWSKQAAALARARFHVLSIDLRGYGRSTGPGQQDVFTAPLHFDVLAAVRFLKRKGVRTVSLIGGSLGGGAAADAATVAAPGEINAVVTLGGLMGNKKPEDLKPRLLVITTRDDANAGGPRLPGIQAAFDKVPGEKQLVVLDGSAHAQFMFETAAGDEVMKLILGFLHRTAK